MKPKVVILSAFLTPFRSGAEACAEEIAARLQHEYDITIVTAKLRKELLYLDCLPSGVRVWRVGLGYGFDKWLYPFLAVRAVRALKPDIVHAVLETFAGFALKLAKGITAKRILTLQTTNRTFLKGPIIRSADMVTAISSALVKRAAELGRNDVTLIPNGIDLKLIDQALAHRPKIDGRILFVGRLEKMKGIDTLLDAFKKIQNSEFRIETSLRIVGDGSLRKELEAKTTELGLNDRVTFTGYLKPEQVAAEFAQAQIFVGLSRSEALGNVFLEAQAAGCAVVATDVGGIPDIVKDGETGLLVNPDDQAAAAEAIVRILSDDSFRERLVNNGQKNASSYGWDAIAARYDDVYKTMTRLRS